MTLNNKLAFEIWVGIVVLVIVIGGVAGVVLMVGNDETSSLARTQVNNPTSTPSPTPEVVSQATPAPLTPGVQEAALAIGDVLSGGAATLP